jgi:hypothetical protein
LTAAADRGPLQGLSRHPDRQGLLPEPSPRCEHLFDYRAARPNTRTLTSQGHAITRLRRSLELRSSALLIRAAAPELSSVPLEDALDICLALLELEPHTYPRTATRWGSRLAIERKLDLVDAQLTFAALAALPGPAARAGVEALVEISGRHGLLRVEGLLLAWLDRRGLGGE